MPDESESRSNAGSSYAWYVVGVLMLLNVLSFVDRQVMSLLVTPIKGDLGLSDTQMGLLLGPAFAITFSFAVFIVGPLADRFSRRAIIGWGVAVWSAMCAASGVANTFSQLFAARVGVGAGEATLSPSAYSPIADYFPPARLSTAMSVFTSGVFIGAGLAYLIGGLVVEAVQGAAPWIIPGIGEVAPWQKVFIVLGLPGLGLALLALTIREPQRSMAQLRAHVPAGGESAATWLRKNAVAYATFGVGIALFSSVNYGTAFWFPAYFERVHDWGPGKIGIFMGGATAIFGTIGVMAGGRLADALKARGRTDGNLLVLILSAIVSAAAAYPLFRPPNEGVLIGALIITNIAAAFPFGAAAAAVQEMTPAWMRGKAGAFLVFLLNFVGLTVGPPAVAFLTDGVFRDLGKVGLSLLTVTVVGRLASAGFVWAGLRHHRRALEALEGVARPAGG